MLSFSLCPKVITLRAFTVFATFFKSRWTVFYDNFWNKIGNWKFKFCFEKQRSFEISWYSFNWKPTKRSLVHMAVWLFWVWGGAGGGGGGGGGRGWYNFKSLKNLSREKHNAKKHGNREPHLCFHNPNPKYPPPPKKKNPPPQWRSNVCASMILNVTTVTERVHLIKCEL